MTPFNTSADPTIAEELAHLHAQLGSHIRRQSVEPQAMNPSSAAFLIRMSLQLDTLKRRALEEEAAEETARAKLGQLRRIMGIGERRAA